MSEGQNTTHNNTTAADAGGGDGAWSGFLEMVSPVTDLLAGWPGIILFVVLMGVITVLLLTHAQARRPDTLAHTHRQLRATEAENRRLHERGEQVMAALRETRAELQATQNQYAEVTRALPQELVTYYEGGHHDAEGQEALERIARREKNAWAALDGTFHTGALVSLFSAMEECVVARRQGVHHQTTQAALERLARVSQDLREDDWFAKALRWIEVQYGR